MMKKQLLFLSMIIGLLSFNYANAQCQPVGPAHPAEGEFVQDQWTAYAYNREWSWGYYYEYRGYYIDNETYGDQNINIKSTLSWDDGESPSIAPSYQGCSVNNNRHRVLYTRKGFPSGNYKIEVKHDNDAWVEINGARVYTDGDWYRPSDPNNVLPNIYYLDENTEIAFQWTEDLGESNGLLEFTKIETDFGNNEWNTVVYKDDNFSALAGNFTHSGISFTTRDKWTADENNTPSNAPNYKGINVDQNNSYVYKRESFPCGEYTIDVAEHDDSAELIINGVSVWNNSGYKLTPTPSVWTGYLDSNSKIEFKIKNDGRYSTSAGLTFTKNNPINPIVTTWLGEVSSDITDPDNWCPGVPGPDTKTIIPDASTTNYSPVLSSYAKVNSLHIQANATIDLSQAHLELTENLMVYGSLVDNTIDQLSLTGASSMINGNGFEVNTLSSEGAAVSLALYPGRSIRVNDVVKVPSGNLDTNNQLVLACQLTDLSKRVAQIDDLSNGAITGSITTEQCIPARRAFRFLSSPVTTSNSIHNNWQEAATAWNDNPNPGFGTHITGSQTDQVNGFDMTTSGNPSLFVFDNATQTWSPIANTDVNTLTAGTPYRLLVRGDRSTDITSNTALASQTTLRATGTITSGNLDLAANFNTSANTYNFFGNPYPAAIDMSQVMASATGVQKDYYVWDPNLGGANNSNTDPNNIGGRGGFVTVDLEAPNIGSNAAGSAANQFLQPGQAAFVRVSAAGSPQMLLNETHKNVAVNQTATFSENPIAMIDMALYKTSDFNNNQTAKDGLRIKFSDQYSTSPSDEDAAKFGNIDENMAVVNDGQYLAIDRREFPMNEESIALFFNQYRTNDYSLSFDLNQMQDYEVYILDTYLEEQTLIEEDNFVFNFSVDANIAESADANRFSLLINPVTLGQEIVTADDLRIYPNPLSDGRLNIDLPKHLQGEFDIKIHSVLGSQLLDLRQEAQNGSIILENLNLASGVYFINITSDQLEQKLVQKLIVK